MLNVAVCIIISDMNDLVLQFNKDGILLRIKGRLENDVFVLSEESLGKPILELMPSDAMQPMMSCFERALQSWEPQHFEYQPGIRGRHYDLKFINSAEDTVLLVITDISDYKQATDKIRYLAYYDILTALPNRYLFNDRLKQAIAHAERAEHLLAILFIDVDNFKQINDTLGHSAGDQVLQGIADRLLSCMRKTDSVSRLSDGASEYPDHVVARIGGDEFTILLTDISNTHDPAKVAQRLLSALSEPFNIGDHDVFITASVGIAVYPPDGKDIETLVINADVAMYEAKKHGKNNYQYYLESMNKFAVKRFTVENKLRRALEHNEFMLFYQPQIDITARRVIGVEALIRWLQPDLILIKPDEFIPLAEESGLIVPIGEWVLRTACEENSVWQKAGFKSIRTTVNVSSIQFSQNNFVDCVSQILRDTGLDPKHLQLELTESTVMRDSPSTIVKLESLQDMGIEIALDDFGTGYSSLNYLKRFPLSTLKIDYSFVKDLDTSADDQAIVNAIVTLAHNFGLKVIAEGVERRQQIAFLHECGCEGVQGHLICPPVNSVILAEFINKEKFLTVLNDCGIRAKNKSKESGY